MLNNHFLVFSRGQHLAILFFEKKIKNQQVQKKVEKMCQNAIIYPSIMFFTPKISPKLIFEIGQKIWFQNCPKN
mgnify:CR=1 FL=1